MKPKKIYLIAKYYARPKNPKNTRFAGYMKDEDNVAWDEQVIITHGLKTKDFDTARVVLNISEQKVERNSFRSDRTFMELFQYFYEANPQEISRGLQQLGVKIGKADEAIKPTEPVVEQIAPSGSTIVS